MTKNAHIDVTKQGELLLDSPCSMRAVESVRERNKAAEVVVDIAKAESILIAHECFKLFSRAGSLDIRFDPLETRKQAIVNEMLDGVFDRLDKDFFNECLAHYGLRFVNEEKYYPANCRGMYGRRVQLERLAE